MPLENYETICTNEHAKLRDAQRAKLAQASVPAAMIDQVVAAVKAPLIAWHDGRFVTFGARHANQVGKICGADTCDDAGRIDARDWNSVLEMLTMAGETVIVTDQ